MRVLFSEVGGSDLGRFVCETLGPLADYDEQRDGALLKTLQAYFDANCSQKEAAEAMPVHHKTLRYRLDKIEELMGLDLNRHPDRIRASIALELLHLADGSRRV